MIRISKLKQGDVILRASRHNKRQIQRELGAHSRIDASRIRHNYCLAGPPAPADVAAKAMALMAEAGIRKLRRDAVRCIEIVFSLHPLTDVDQAAYFADALAWTCTRFGAENVLSADVHLDEGAPHCHVLILPLKDGKMNGSALVGYKGKLTKLLHDFEQEVMAAHRLKAPKQRQTYAWNAQALLAVMAALENCNVNIFSSPVGSLLQEVIVANPHPWLFALGLTPPLPTKLRENCA